MFLEKMENTWSTYHEWIIEGLKTTMFVSFFSIAIGLLAGVIIGYFRNVHVSRKDNKFIKGIKIGIKKILDFYIAIFRYTPFYVQLFFVWYWLFVGKAEAQTIAILVLACNTAAFQAKVIEGGINSIDQGQYKAGRSLGLSHRRTFFTIILPQGFRNMIPGFSNEWVNVIKATSIITLIGVADMMNKIKQITNSTEEYVAPYFIAILIYFAICFLFAFILKIADWVMKRLW